MHRYFFAHRASARLSDRSGWGSGRRPSSSGVDREFDGRYRNPLSLLLLANQYGLGADGNVLFGADAHWRVRGRTTLAGAARASTTCSTRTPPATTRYPNRWALTVAAASARWAAHLGWRAFYTQASSLAFRTLDPFESFTDAGVGTRPQLRRHGPAHAHGSACRAATRWLLTPELTLLRQGEGEINDPFPADGRARQARCPQLFIGVVERTWRAAVAICAAARGRSTCT